MNNPLLQTPPITSFDEYQRAAEDTAQYPNKGNELRYPAMGLAGEAGEVLEKVKKLWRNKGITSRAFMSEEDRVILLAELGDVLWYAAAMATELNYLLSAVATANISKLKDRASRNVIKSEGDTR